MSKDNYNIEKEKLNRRVIDHIPDYAFFLSYGENGGYIPAGVFAFNGFVDENHHPIEGKYPIDISEIYVELVEFDVNSNYYLQIKPNYECIYMPLLKFSNLLEKHADNNHSELVRIADDRLITHELMAAFKNVVSEKLISCMALNREINFAGESLDDINATLVSSDGEEREANYTIMPFSLGKFKVLIKDLPLDHEINPYGIGEEEVHLKM